MADTVDMPGDRFNWPLYVAAWMLGSVAVGGAVLGTAFVIWNKAEPYWRWRALILGALRKVWRR